MISFSEILIVLVVVLIIFGAGKFPQIMQNIAEGINSFKKTITKDNKNAKEKTETKTKKTTTKTK